jgi:hypothetical protein
MRDLLTRRSVLSVAIGAGAAGRLLAFSSDFWNKKDPSEWNHEEIEQLTNKSPWAKDVSASAPVQQGYGQQGGGGYPAGGGYPGGGYPGGGYPGGGGMGRRGGGMGRGPMSQTIKGVVRWESAKPILEALRTPLPKEFENRYVISVSGFPLDGGQRRRQQYPNQDDDSQSQRSVQDQLDRLKQVTFLEPKSRRDAQPGIVQQPVSSTYGSIWFGFDRDFLNLKEEDKEVTFETQLGRMSIKAKFNLKDMMYKGQLAV